MGRVPASVGAYEPGREIVAIAMDIPADSNIHLHPTAASGGIRLGCYWLTCVLEPAYVQVAPIWYLPPGNALVRFGSRSDLGGGKRNTNRDGHIGREPLVAGYRF